MKAVFAALSLSLLAAPALAQVQPAPYPYGYPSVADHHRYEMDRLRYRSDLNALSARQLQLERRLTARELEAARQPLLYLEPQPRLLRAPEAEAAAREAQTRRRQTVEGGTAQIDRWLDSGRSR